MSDPAFWDNPDEAQKIAQEVTRLKDSIGQYRDMADRHSDMAVLWQLGMEENDESVYPEVAAALTALERDMEHLELTLMLSGEYDANNAILTLHAGAGGTEAQDWAQMLLRMYVRWAEKIITNWKPWTFWPEMRLG